MYKILGLIAFLILLGAGCSSTAPVSQIPKTSDTTSTQQIVQEQEEKIDELTKKVETLSASLSSTSTIPSSVKTIIKEVQKKDNSGEVAKLKARVKELENQPIQTLKVSGSSKINYSTFIPYVVKIVCQDGAGSGTIISPNTILTNYHVIEGNTECLVGFTIDVAKAPSEWVVGKITAANSSLDRALIQVDTPFANKTIKRCNATDTQIADDLIIIGYPSAGGNTITITNGNISGFIDYYIKTSAKINPGNSGGAAIHESGCYLGIPTAYVKGQAESLGLIIDERIGGAINDNNASLSPIDETYRQEAEKKRQEELLKQQEQERLEVERQAQIQREAQAQEQARQAEIARQVQAQREAQAQAEALKAEIARKEALLAQMTTECNNPINEMKQQIIQLKADYYKKVEDIRNKPMTMNSINGAIARLTDDTNVLINVINNNIEQKQLECSIKYGN